MRLTVKIDIKSGGKDYSVEYDTIELIKDTSGFNDWEETRDGPYVLMELSKPYYTYEDDLSYVSHELDSRVVIKSEMRDRSDVIYTKFFRGIATEIEKEEYDE